MICKPHHIGRWFYGSFFPIVLFILRACSLAYGLEFESGPGVIKVHHGDSVQLIWTLDTDLVFDDGLNFYHTKISRDTLMVSRFFGKEDYYNDYTVHKVQISTENALSGITIFQANTTDAMTYVQEIHPPGDAISNRDAKMFLYDKPRQANMTRSPKTTAENDTLTLTCEAESTSVPAAIRPDAPMSYTWIRDNDTLNPFKLPERHSISGDHNNSLIISDLMRVDAGHIYACYGQEEGSRLTSDASETYLLIVDYAPGGTTSGGDQTAVAGDEGVSLSCFADRGEPPGSFMWVTPSGGNVTTGSSGNLTIDDVSVDDDDGVYKCYVQNYVGSGPPAFVKLTVNAQPTQEPPLVDVTIPNTDDTLNVSCNFRARPAAEVKWKYLNTSSLPGNIFNTSLSTQVDDGKYKITTQYLQWANSNQDSRRGKGGEIMCDGSNGIGGPVNSDVIMLDIIYAPYDQTISPPDPEEVNEGNSSISRFCSANCNPECTYSWIFDGSVVSNSSELLLANIHRNDHGTYTCNATNSIDSITGMDFDLTVNYGPELGDIQVSPPNGSIIASNSTTFTCIVDSRPDASILLLDPQDEVLATGSGAQLQHTIYSVGCSNSGHYRCEANNIKTGKQNATEMSVLVLCPPSTQHWYPQNRKHGAPRGGSAVFYVEVESHPPPFYTWRHSDNTTGNVTVAHNGTGDNITLEVTNITNNDYGYYMVEAFNAYGSLHEEDPFLLVPNDKPDPPKIQEPPTATAVSVTIKWIPGFNGGYTQTFTIEYITGGNSRAVQGIPDSSSPIIYKLNQSHGIKPNTEYNISIWASNQLGNSSVVEIGAVQTRAIPDFKVNSIDIQEDHAIIDWTLDVELVTHVIVDSCLSTTCIMTNVTGLSVNPVRVDVPPGGKEYLFTFSLYDGEDMVFKEEKLQGPGSDPNIGLYVGAALGAIAAIVLVIVAVVFFMKWRRNKPTGKDADHEMNPKGNLLNGNNIGPHQGLDNPAGNSFTDDELSPYGETKASVDNQINQDKLGPTAPADIYAIPDKNKKKANEDTLLVDNTLYEEVTKKGSDKKMAAPKPPKEGQQNGVDVADNLAVYSEVNKSAKKPEAKKKKVPTATLR